MTDWWDRWVETEDKWGRRVGPFWFWFWSGFLIFFILAVAEGILDIELGGIRYLIFGVIMAAWGVWLAREAKRRGASEQR